MSDNTTAGRRLEKFPAFDGFRGIGVVVVIFSHCPLVIESATYNAIWHINQLSRVGYIALDIFFVMSGFFISRLLPRERAKTGRISFKDFYIRRALRIFPVYYLTVIACLFIFKFSTSDAISLFSYTFNFYHPLHPVPNPLEHTWSLSVEEQFYFFWPLLILLVPPRWLNRVMGVLVPLLAIASGLVMAAIFINHDPREAGDVVYMSLFTRMLSLSLGGWLALREAENKPLRGWRCLALFLGAIVVLTLDRMGRNLGIITSQPVYWTNALIAYAMVSVAFAATMVFDNGILKRLMTAILSISPLRALGRMSYAMYVFHLPVLFYLGINDAELQWRQSPGPAGRTCFRHHNPAFDPVLLFSGNADGQAEGEFWQGPARGACWLEQRAGEREAGSVRAGCLQIARGHPRRRTFIATIAGMDRSAARLNQLAFTQICMSVQCQMYDIAPGIDEAASLRLSARTTAAMPCFAGRPFG